MNRSCFFLSCLLLACGARTELGAPHADAGAGSACITAPAPASHCTTWTAGAAQTIGAAAPSTDAIAVAATTRTGCGALVAWYDLAGEGQGPLSWTTRLVGFDGAPLAPAIAHPSLTSQVDSDGAMSLVQNGSTVGALEDDASGCRFVGLDASGHESGDVVPLGAAGCQALAALGGGSWSFLRASGSAGTVVAFDGGGTKSEAPLALPAPAWDRLVFDDGSFLVTAFSEDPVTVQYTNWLTPFDASGNVLGPSVTYGTPNTAPLWLVATTTGALVMWQGDAAYVEPIDRHGNPTGPVVNVTGPATIYETLLLPAPDGDVLLVWDQLDGSDFSRWAIALAPDGTPRGAASLLEPKTETARMWGAVESTGARAVVAFDTSDGIQALPLTCVP